MGKSRWLHRADEAQEADAQADSAASPHLLLARGKKPLSLRDWKIWTMAKPRLWRYGDAGNLYEREASLSTSEWAARSHPRVACLPPHAGPERSGLLAPPSEGHAAEPPPRFHVHGGRKLRVCLPVLCPSCATRGWRSHIGQASACQQCRSAALQIRWRERALSASRHGEPHPGATRCPRLGQCLEVEPARSAAGSIYSTPICFQSPKPQLTAFAVLLLPMPDQRQMPQHGERLFVKLLGSESGRVRESGNAPGSVVNSFRCEAVAQPCAGKLTVVLRDCCVCSRWESACVRSCDARLHAHCLAATKRAARPRKGRQRCRSRLWYLL